jgi:hypothetical protein
VASNPYIKVSDGTMWPRPRIEELEWLLRYGQPADLERIRFVAASVVNAYGTLIEATNGRRNSVANDLKILSRED